MKHYFLSYQLVFRPDLRRALADALGHLLWPFMSSLEKVTVTCWGDKRQEAKLSHAQSKRYTPWRKGSEQ